MIVEANVATTSEPTVIDLPTTKIVAEIEGGVGWLTYNNPQRRNALSLEMQEASAAVLRRFQEDDAVRVVVLRGAGGRAFVSGADISEFEKLRTTVEARERYDRAGRLGVGYGFAGIKVLVDLVGPSRTSEILLTARRFNAAEALHMGLIDRVTTAEELESTVRDLAGRMAENAPLTLRAAKFAIRQATKDPERRGSHGADRRFACQRRLHLHLAAGSGGEVGGSAVMRYGAGSGGDALGRAQRADLRRVSELRWGPCRPQLLLGWRSRLAARRRRQLRR